MVTMLRAAALASCFVLCACQSSLDKQPAPAPATTGYKLLKAAELAGSAAEIEKVWSAPTEARTFPGEGGVEIAYRIYRQPQPSPAVVISSGRTEHFGKYREVVYDLWRNGYSVYIHDHRGQGVSGRMIAGDDPEHRQRGHVVRFDDYVADLHTFVKAHVVPHHSARYLIGHSMGGGIATLYLIQHRDVFQRAVLSSPMHRPDTSPFRLLTCPFTTATRAISPESWVLFGLANTLYEEPGGDNIYTSSPERLQHWFIKGTADKDRIGSPTRNWLAEACLASARMLNEAKDISTPVMVLQSEDDQAVVPAAQDEFCRILGAAGKRCHPHGAPVSYPTTVKASEPDPPQPVGHELLIERDTVRTDAMTRILDFFGGGGKGK